MKKVVKLNEKDLERIVKKTIKENKMNESTENSYSEYEKKVHKLESDFDGEIDKFIESLKQYGPRAMELRGEIETSDSGLSEMDIEDLTSYLYFYEELSNIDNRLYGELKQKITEAIYYLGL